MAANAALSDRLRALIRDVPDFPRPGILFRDITPLLRDASAFADAVAAMADPHAGSVDLVAGIESRGFILGGAVARILRAGFVAVRKQGRLPGEVRAAAYVLEYGEAVLEMHVDAVTTGHRVLIVDDLLATGGTAAAAASLVREGGGEVVAASFLIELSALHGGRALAPVPWTALVRY